MGILRIFGIGKRKLSTYRFFERIGPEEFKIILDNIKPKKCLLTYSMTSITTLPYGEVIDYVGRCAEMTPFEMVASFLNWQKSGISEYKLLKSDSSEFVAFLRHLRDEVNKVIKLMENLQTEPDPDLMNAGIEKLDKYGVMNVYYSINKDPDTWDRSSNTPFEKMYVKLSMDKDNAEINKSYNQIMNEKQKHK